jgi:hypothetical protein
MSVGYAGSKQENGYGDQAKPDDQRYCGPGEEKRWS